MSAEIPFPPCASSEFIQESSAHRPLLLYQASRTQSSRTQAHASQRLVLHACPCALRSGVKRGMTVTLAESLCARNPLVISSQPEQEASLLYRLARWALKFSPLVAIDTELSEAIRSKSLHTLSPLHYCFSIDLTGTERIHGSEISIISRLARALSSRNVTARYAITPSPGASWAHAHFGGESPVIIEDSPNSTAVLEQSLYSLPIESLRLTTADSLSLRSLGIIKVGELLKIPLSKLGLRFPDAQGPRGILTRLRQALGTQHEALCFIHAKTVLSAKKTFDIPASSHEAIGFVILELLKEVFERLAFERKNTRALILELHTRSIDRTVSTIRKELTLCHATRDLIHAKSVIAPIIESIRNVEGVVFISVTARLTTTAQFCQKPLPQLAHGQGATLDKGETDDASVGELLNHLVARCGKERVVRVLRHDSYLPEKSFSYQSVASHSVSRAAAPPATVPGATVPKTTSGASLNRPSYLFDTPEPVSAIAMLPDKPPSQLLWNGERLRVAAAEGPERISLEWWQHSLNGTEAQLQSNVAAQPRNNLAAQSRDYFSLQDHTGRWLWVFRDNSSSQWFVHGLWL